jgi:concentrative nucleoside transporter, CNT family
VERFIGLLGVMLILGIAFLISNNRKAIPYPLIIKGLGLQLGLAIFILKVPVGQQMFAWIARLIEKVLQFSDAGANFVFGPLVNQLILTKSFGAGNDFIFFFKVIPTIIFVSVLVNMAYHIGLMQRIVAGVARVMHFVMGVSGSGNGVLACQIHPGCTL